MPVRQDASRSSSSQVGLEPALLRRARAAVDVRIEGNQMPGTQVIAVVAHPLRPGGTAEVAKVACRTRGDRKSTRLNSSHVKISYAVFCLKKKKKTKSIPTAAKGNNKTRN